MVENKPRSIKFKANSTPSLLLEFRTKKSSKFDLENIKVRTIAEIMVCLYHKIYMMDQGR